MHLLDTIEADKVISPKKSVRWAGVYLIFLGMIFSVLGSIASSLSKQQIRLSIICLLSANLIISVTYLIAQRTNN